MHATGEYSVSDLAEFFSVSRPTVYRTLNRRHSPYRTILPPTGIDPISGARPDWGTNGRTCPKLEITLRTRLPACRLPGDDLDWWGVLLKTALQLTGHFEISAGQVNLALGLVSRAPAAVR